MLSHCGGNSYTTKFSNICIQTDPIKAIDANVGIINQKVFTLWFWFQIRSHCLKNEQLIDITSLGDWQSNLRGWFCCSPPKLEDQNKSTGQANNLQGDFSKWRMYVDRCLSSTNGFRKKAACVRKIGFRRMHFEVFPLPLIHFTSWVNRCLVMVMFKDWTWSIKVWISWFCSIELVYNDEHSHHIMNAMIITSCTTNWTVLDCSRMYCL